MDQLVETLMGLGTTPQHLAVIMQLGSCLLLVLCFLLIGQRILRSAMKSQQSKNLHIDRERVLRFISSGDANLLRGLHVNAELRDLIVRLCAYIQGDERVKLIALYANLGFVAKDYKKLRSFSYKQKALALDRLRTMGVPMPDPMFRYLLSLPKQSLRWAALEYLIFRKGRFSLPWILAYFHVTPRRKKGIVLHLLSCLASYHSETIPMLLNHTDDPLMREQCLRVLGSYPTPSARRIVLSSIRAGEQGETLIAGVRALAANPDKDAVPALADLSGHPDWVVRMMVAQALKSYPVPQSVVILNHLAQDASYFVREKAVVSLMALDGNAEEVIAGIRDDNQHPSHLILDYQEGLNAA